MVKRIIGSKQKDPSDNEQWLGFDALTHIEVSSEEEAHPIESALLPKSGSGWQASESGPQTVVLFFNRPEKIRRVHLEFNEPNAARTQEFVLRWSSNSGRSYREIVRQQYNFSPPNTTTEREDYSVDLDSVTNIELTIIPEIGGGPACASLVQLCVG